MNMVRYAADPKALAVGVTGHGCQVGVEVGTYGQIEVWGTILRAEDEANEQKGERLRHAKRIDRAFSPCLPLDGLNPGRATPDSGMG